MARVKKAVAVLQLDITDHVIFTCSNCGAEVDFLGGQPRCQRCKSEITGVRKDCRVEKK